MHFELLSFAKPQVAWQIDENYIYIIYTFREEAGTTDDQNALLARASNHTTATADKNYDIKRAEKSIMESIGEFISWELLGLSVMPPTDPSAAQA